MPQAKEFQPDNGPTNRTTRQLERFLQRALEGDRTGCRDSIREFMDEGHDAADALHQLVWPACSMVDSLARRDQISAVQEHCATVLLTQLAQRVECGLTRHPSRCRTMIVTTGPRATEELAGEIFAGLAEADGFDVVFLGGGVESDDLYAEIGKRQPQFVLSFAAAGPDAARLRRLIAMVRTQNPVPGLRIGVGAGVFARAPGLADEIGADFDADSPFELLEAVRALANDGSQRRSPRARAA